MWRRSNVQPRSDGWRRLYPARELTLEEPSAGSAGAAPAPDEDESTRAYFEEHAPEYGTGRLRRTAEFIRREAGPGASLLDVGCGAGNTLVYLRDETGVSDVAGLDISPHYLQLTRERLGCETYEGSILDASLVETLGPRFDFVVLAAVLHHLIGSSRRESKGFARLAVANAFKLLKPNGFVLIHEPIYSPRPFTWAVFWAKKLGTALTSNRIELATSWANIGPPVVSYLSNEELLRMVSSQPGSRVADLEIEPGPLPPLVNQLFGHEQTTVAAQSLGAA
jgi:2-polyprenyl-3-methyl-5-hydroxy-6-metoxy-1,4-benzoquinol methylase